MSRFVAVDLSGLEPPDIVETLDYETILGEMLEDAVARLRADGVPYDVEALESDPVVKVLEAAAYRETILRARVNSSVKAVMIAYAQKADLEQRAAHYGVTRLEGETDAALLERIQLAPEALATTGPAGAYRFHVRTHDVSIRDVGTRRVIETDGNERHVQVRVSFLTDTGDGTPSTELIASVTARLHDEDIKPLTDELLVMPPPISEYTVDCQLQIASGPDAATVVAASKAAIEAYCAARHRIGHTVYRSGIVAAAKVAGVEDVTLVTPAANIVPDPDGAAYATAVTVTQA